MHLQRRLAVFQVVVHPDGLPGELALLADQDQRLVQVVRERGAVDKAAGLRADDHVIIEVCDHLLHGIDRELEAVRILEHCGDIAEHDAGLRKIGNSTDIIF